LRQNDNNGIQKRLKQLIAVSQVDPEAAEFAAIAEYFHRLAAAAAAGKKFG
jgi:hypothetical protein